jgi:hypothetical protein
MPIEAISQHPIVQICYLVDDVDSAVHRWVQVMGAGPFFIMRHVPLREVTFRGEPTVYDHSAALGQWGDMQVELHQQHCDHPSPVKEMFAPGETGLLQISWLTDDLPGETQRLEALGFPAIWTCLAEQDLRTIWFDARPLVGTMIEIYKGNQASWRELRCALEYPLRSIFFSHRSEAKYAV